MAFTVPHITLLGDSKHGGALFTLPREIRDDIYRLLVKGLYHVFRHIDSERGISFIQRHGSRTRSDKPDLVVLLISKVISREAQQILYSESIFRYSVPLYTNATLKPQNEALNRIKNIEIVLSDLADPDTHTRYDSGGSTYPYRNIITVCEAIIGDFTGAEILRDTLRINFRACSPEKIKPLTRHILPKLCALTGFRTIVVKVIPHRTRRDRMKEEQSKNMGSSGEITAGFEQVRQAIKDTMEPSLGPATTRNIGFSIYLEFHPREHMPAIFRAQAQKLMLDADRLEQAG